MTYFIYIWEIRGSIMNVIAHNITAMNANRQLNIVTGRRAKSTEKLSSGYRINRAADDAAGLAISEKMRWMIRGLDQGAENTQDGISFVQIGDGAMNEVHDMVHRMTELAIQAANGTQTDTDRGFIDQEIKQLKNEINRIAETTVFNEIPVFDNHSVVFGLEGEPNDLQIYNASYDMAQGLTEYGGFVFHGERISWDTIDPDMVTVDATTGKQVFKGGDYSYTSPTTGYSFAFHCKDGEEVPVVTRDISIDADSSGITLGGEKFGWDKVYDLNGNTLSEDTLHAGPWAIYYYGAKFTFLLPEPVTDIASAAKDIDSNKSATVYYDWEGSYGSSFVGEKAVDAYSPDVSSDRVTQDAAYNMYNHTHDGVEFTVRADDAGVWLETNTGTELAGTKKTWAELGIDSWEDGMTTPGYENGNVKASYTFEDTVTDVKFDFHLSDITSKDSVIDGLDGMKLEGFPEKTFYTPTLTVGSNGGVRSGNITLENIWLTFGEELDVNRNFDTEKWSMDTGASYSAANDTLTFAFAGGYTLSGKTYSDDTHSVVENYMRWVYAQKAADLLAGNTGTNVRFTDYHGATEGDISYVLDHTGGGTMRMTYAYDYSNQLSNLTDNVQVTIEETQYQSVLGGYYVKQADGSYADSWDLLQQRYATIDADASLTDDEKTAQKNTAHSELYALQKYVLQVDYVRENGYSTTGYSEMIEDAKDVVGGEIANASDLTLTSSSYSRMYYLRGEEKGSVAYRSRFDHYLKETPVEPDIYIVHSGMPNDKTGIPRYAMNTTALGIAFASCATVEGAMQTIESAKNALAYVSSKRASYGAIQNRLEHTLKNIRNVSENTQAAESRIRDTDMAKEMLEYTKDNIIAQAGQTILAQANQSKQGILSLLG